MGTNRISMEPTPQFLRQLADMVECGTAYVQFVNYHIGHDTRHFVSDKYGDLYGIAGRRTEDRLELDIILIEPIERRALSGPTAVPAEPMVRQVMINSNTDQVLRTEIPETKLVLERFVAMVKVIVKAWFESLIRALYTLEDMIKAIVTAWAADVVTAAHYRTQLLELK